MKSWLYKARKASNLSVEDCASTISCSRNTFISRENNPGTLSLDEVFALYGVFNEAGREILRASINGFIS